MIIIIFDRKSQFFCFRWKFCHRIQRKFQPFKCLSAILRHIKHGEILTCIRQSCKSEIICKKEQTFGNAHILVKRITVDLCPGRTAVLRLFKVIKAASTGSVHHIQPVTGNIIDEIIHIAVFCIKFPRIRIADFLTGLCFRFCLCFIGNCRLVFFLINITISIGRTLINYSPPLINFPGERPIVWDCRADHRSATDDRCRSCRHKFCDPQILFFPCLLFFCLFSGDKPEEKTNCHDRCSHSHFLSVVAYSSKLA